MSFRKILRHLLFPVSCGSPVVHAKSKDGESGKVRASDLPLYAEEDKVVKCANDCPKSLIEETICCLRQELEILISQGKIVKAQVSDFVHTSSAVTQDTIKFLRKDENSVPRYGAIAIGSASGYILALRKGIFKRLLYTTAGGSAVAALCYPCEAKQFAGEAVVHAKRYFVIGYHLLNGDQVNYEKLNRDLCNEIEEKHLALADCHKKEGKKGSSSSKSDNKFSHDSQCDNQDPSQPPSEPPPPPPPKDQPPPPPPCNLPPPPPSSDPSCIPPPCPPGYTLSTNPVSSPEQQSENWCPVHGRYG
ncbi:MICOS complex subunit MIC27-like isoform X3 [Cimex lectularius]|uniref:MICOS complex subunit n=1 Tax=Cimex lectularius TaxID=79782 RepID=A0A8I6RL18_CIMLE|nr:MICOS complex subunit MIC27-like isoform X3 [Cimex lectularius]